MANFRWSVALVLVSAFLVGAQLPAFAKAPEEVKNKAKPAAKVDLAGKKAKEKGAEKKGKFLRVVQTDGGDPVAMETSVARYVGKGGKDGVSVELISAVHIGEASYYTQLNKLFSDYDALLYELVAPEGTKVPKGGGKPTGFVSGLQNGMKDMLQLEFQLSEVDYTKENFVHADMSPEQFAKAMSDRGESIWTMMATMMGQSMAQQASGEAPSDMELLMALFDSNRALKLKRLMARQFENLDTVTMALSGPKGSALIEGRNEAALAVLKKQIEAGKKKIGIFYGAGHMPDMEKRLLADFGLRPEGERWIEAWDLRDKAPVEKKKKQAPASGKKAKQREPVRAS
ncbi:MAG: hypothetical protein SGJ20_02495 [Planctomycetota bacterium]|nr:hypothetical protein [Planctomycetota bacterium]